MDITKRYQSYVAERTFRAAQLSLERMVPAAYGYGEGESYINCSRDELTERGTYEHGRSFERPSDKTLSVLRFNDLSGRLIAVWINYAVHNNMCFGQRDRDGVGLMVSGDISGEVCRFVEDRYGDAVAVWTAGAAGNQNPIWRNEYPRFHRDGSRTPDYYRVGYDMWGVCEHVGQTQGLDVIRVLEGNLRMSRTAKLTVSARDLLLPGTRVAGFTRDMILHSELIERNKITNEDGPPVPLGLALFTIGDVALYGVNGEVMCETGLRIKERSPLKNTVIVSLMGNNPAGKYMVDDWGYENRTFAYYRNVIAQGEAEKSILNSLEEMLEERFEQ